MTSKMKRKKANDDNRCICDKPDEALMIQCTKEGCPSVWWHIECAGLQGITAAVCKKVHWVCPCCIVSNFSDKLVTDNIENISLDAGLKEEIKQSIIEFLPGMVSDILQSVQPTSDALKHDMKKSFAEVMKEQQKSDNHTPITKDLIKEALTEEKIEQQKLDQRKKNIMIFDAPEAEVENTDEANQADKELFVDICNYADSTILQTNDDIVSIRRLGKKESTKTRPLMVSVQNERTKRKLFSNIPKLQQSNLYKDIKFNHDRTADEREATKKKVKDAKKKTEDLQNDSTLTDDAKNWVFLVRGPPWDQRTVKVRPRIRIQDV